RGLLGDERVVAAAGPVVLDLLGPLLEWGSQRPVQLALGLVELGVTRAAVAAGAAVHVDDVGDEDGGVHARCNPALGVSSAWRAAASAAMKAAYCRASSSVRVRRCSTTAKAVFSSTIWAARTPTGARVSLKIWN